jgi:hypothetical protein
MLPLFGFVGAVAGLTVALTRRTRHDEERWTLDRRKRERRDNKSSLGVPPRETGERREGERRRGAKPDVSAN